MEQEQQQNAQAMPADNVGGRLRAAREASGRTLEQLAAETRISLRHLELIEQGKFAELPARIYAVGFSRTYARTVGLDEAAVLDDVRAVLEQTDNSYPRRMSSSLEPGDPARVPSRALGWIAAAATCVLLIGLFLVADDMFSPGVTPAPLTAEQQAPHSASRAAVAHNTPDPLAATGTVVFTALEDGVWVKFYDKDGRQLMQKQMVLGERYVVPADAQGPQIWTARPDALDITIGGRKVPKLAENQTVIKDVPVTAEALTARAAPEPAPAVPSPTA